MADKLIAVPESLLDDIGRAIGDKRDIVTPIPVPDMAMQIGLIDGGGSENEPVADFSFELAEDFRSTTNTIVYTSSVFITSFEANKAYLYKASYDGEWDDNDPNMYNEGIGVLFFTSTENNNTQDPTLYQASRNGGIFASSGNIHISIGRSSSKNGRINVSMRANVGTRYYKAGTYRIRIYEI